MKQVFEDEFLSTIAVDKNVKEVEIKNQKITLEIWDIVGQEKYRAINKIFMKNTQITLLVYHIINQESFDNLNEWYNYFLKFNEKNNTVIGVVGNKSDLYEDRVIEEEKGKEYTYEKNFCSLKLMLKIMKVL